MNEFKDLSPDEQRERLETKRKQLVMDYQLTFSDGDPATRVLRDLMSRFHIMTSTFEAGDPYGTAHQEGQRDVVLHILQMLRMTDLEYVNIVRTSLPSDVDTGEVS